MNRTDSRLIEVLTPLAAMGYTFRKCSDDIILVHSPRLRSSRYVTIAGILGAKRPACYVLARFG